ncbi:MAG: methyltransferase domain-containing protein [Pseudomonadota bacterium]|nr:methyltransferase domain-containing protein [Pseudomonadota bacterium]
MDRRRRFLHNPAMTALPQIFDRRLLRHRLARAADGWAGHDFLRREMVERLADRLLDLDRRFARAVEIDARDGLLAAHPAVAARVARLDSLALTAKLADGRRPAAVADGEALPLAEGALDALFSVGGLHAMNDLPGCLVQIRRALVSDGLFLGVILGGESLSELRAALTAAESEVEGGVSPRVAPSVDVRDLGGLLQRAGFALPVVDADRLTVTYDDVFALMRDLRGMAEGNLLHGRRRDFSRRATFLRMAEIYHARHATADGRVAATFELLFMTAWAPGAGQQRPLRPGSGDRALGDALR